MSTMTRIGHCRLPNGSVVRVDFEMGRWVGTLYAPSMTVKTQIVGSDTEVHAWALPASRHNATWLRDLTGFAAGLRSRAVVQRAPQRDLGEVRRVHCCDHINAGVTGERRKQTQCC